MLRMEDGIACTAGICRIKHASKRYLKAKKFNLNNVTVAFREETDEGLLFAVQRLDSSEAIEWEITVTYDDVKMLAQDLRGKDELGVPFDVAHLQSKDPNYESVDGSRRILSAYWAKLPERLRIEPEAAKHVRAVFDSTGPLGFELSADFLLKGGGGYHRILHVTEGGAAEKKGLRAGMHVLTLQDIKVGTLAHPYPLNAMLEKRPFAVVANSLDTQEQAQWAFEQGWSDRRQSCQTKWQTPKQYWESQSGADCRAITHRVFVHGHGEGHIVERKGGGWAQTLWPNGPLKGREKDRLYVIQFQEQLGPQELRLQFADEDADVWLITVDGGHDAIEAMEASATGPKQAFERLDQSLPLLPDLASEGLKGAMVDLVSGKRSTKATGQLIEQYLRALIQHPLLSDSPALLQFPNTFSQEDKLGSDSRWMTMYKQASNVTEKAAKKKLQAMADKW